MRGDPPKVTLGWGIPSDPGRGVPVFFEMGIPPLANVHEGGPPSRAPQGGGIPYFSGRVSRRNLIR